MRSNLGKISVGPPYFSAMFLVPMLPLVFLLAPGMHAAWKRASFERTKVLLAVLLGCGDRARHRRFRRSHTAGIRCSSAVGIVAALWVAFAALVEPIERWRKGHSLSAGVLGMSVAHFGLAMFILGATTVESYKQEKDLSLRPGQSTERRRLHVHDEQPARRRWPELRSGRERSRRSRAMAEQIATLHPQKRIYRVQKNAMTEAGIDGALESRSVRRDGRAARRRRLEPAPAVQADGALHLAGRARHRDRRPDRRVRSTLSPARHGRRHESARRPATKTPEPKSRMWRFMHSDRPVRCARRASCSSVSAATRKRCRRR